MNRHLRPHKPTFKFLCIALSIKPEALAQASGLRPVIALALYHGYGATPKVALAALTGLNQIAGTHFSLSDIDIELHEREERP
jgi:hypothetical protein